MASQSQQGKELHAELLRMKWYKRAPIGLVSAGVIVGGSLWLSEHIKYPWIAHACAAVVGLYCLILAWEVVLVCCLVALVWYVATSLPPTEQMGVVGLILYVWHDVRINTLKQRIGMLELREAQVRVSWRN